MRQQVPQPFPFQPRFDRCRRCRKKFMKNRRDRFYCGETCQKNLRTPSDSKEVVRAFTALESLFKTQSMHELTRTFEIETGMPFAVQLIHLPKKRAAVHDDRPPREEQGGVWWNMDPEPADEEPTDIEHRLRARLPATQHQGETVDEWLARGGTVKVLPPGKAMATTLF